MNNSTHFAIITGASTGIGKYIAIELAKHAIEVILIARDKKKKEEYKLYSANASNGKWVIKKTNCQENVNFYFLKE